ncbi:MAG: rhodanese-like domain-containing protein [Cyclobacteriaceae bacterium]
MKLLDNLFGRGSHSLNQYLANGALIVDVRTVIEFEAGHISQSKNIPLKKLESSLVEIKRMKKPLILCCASGMRSRQATSYLKSQGIDCVNGGGWSKVERFIRNLEKKEG